MPRIAELSAYANARAIYGLSKAYLLFEATSHNFLNVFLQQHYYNKT